MGCSSTSPNLINDDDVLQSDPINDNNNNHNNNNNQLQQKRTFRESKAAFNYKYTVYNFQMESQHNSNMLIYTSFTNLNNDFNVIFDKQKDKTEQSSFKSSPHGIAIGYKKGYKLEFVNQDKFFVLLDSPLQLYCVIDGHGPFGNKIAQIIQDHLFVHFTKFNRSDFVNEPEKYFVSLFEGINVTINNREEKIYDTYDPFLSGAAVTIIVRLHNVLYCANVGNVLAMVFSSDKLCPSKFHITQLLFNDSNFKEETMNGLPKKIDSPTADAIVIENLINPALITDEIRRIYENGGETRRLQGEVKSRIFVKGKYFPGLINTRSIGDQVGGGIGVKPTPHYSKYSMTKDVNYYLLLCSDGINNVCSIEKLVNIVQNNDVQSQSMYRTHLYTPDMTVILKELKIDE